jgi:hypothetical protein
MSEDSPLIGKNLLILCEATMQRILEDYLNSKTLVGG